MLFPASALPTSLGSEALPSRVENEEQLDELLTRPTPELIRDIRELASPLLILGAGGKMGPTLSVLAVRAAQAAGHPLKVIAVSRFSNISTRAWLEERGVQTLVADLLDPEPVAQLPESPNVLHLVGQKFGTHENPGATWAMNTVAPWLVAERFRHARIVALSTGNVYSLSPVADGGATEEVPLAPVGEYANAALGRERVFAYAAQRFGIRIAVLRLFYAVELRYGVLVDLARLIHQGKELPLENGAFNCIWQRDANDCVLRAFALASSPASFWNLCQPATYSVRETATRLGELLGQSPRIVGQESSTALLGNATRLCSLLGVPRVGLETLLPWVAHWVKTDQRSFNKPTRFEVRDGRY